MSTDLREAWRTRLLERHSNQLSMQEISNIATEIESELQARLALAMREAAKRSCGFCAQENEPNFVEYFGSKSWRHFWPAPPGEINPRWESCLASSILSLHPEYEKVLVEHDAALRNRIVKAIDENHIKLEADNAALREALRWSIEEVEARDVCMITEEPERTDKIKEARALLGGL